jgi:hypothetical protein
MEGSKLNPYILVYLKLIFMFQLSLMTTENQGAAGTTGGNQATGQGNQTAPTLNPQAAQAAQRMGQPQPTLGQPTFVAPGQYPANWNPALNIDTRNRGSQQSRPAAFKRIPVLEVRPYRDKNGRPRVAFNQGSVHISDAQLTSAGVNNPWSLVGREILVDFFRPGDILLNGSVVTRDGIIVNRFAVEPNHEVENRLEYELKKEQLTGWKSMASMAVGANQRPQGQGLGFLTDNGIGRVADAGNQTDYSQTPAGSTIDQRFQGAPPAMQDVPAGSQAGSNQGAEGQNQGQGNQNQGG